MNANSNNRPMHKRAALYARFSTKGQNPLSCADQLTLCRAYAEREGFVVTASYEDSAMSGASMVGRDGVNALLSAAHNGQFDVVVVEDLNRLSRDMENMSGAHKRLTFAGIQIFEVHGGFADTMKVGLKGLMGQMYLEDNANKVRRGMAGMLTRGLVAGGLTYGYAPVKGEEGKRTIVDHEAAIVRRIFQAYIDGETPRDIASALNREGIPAPRSAAWNASTINGNPQRGNGILHNPLYAGRTVWNRVHMIKDPDTGRRISRVNPESEWKVANLPDLAIVSPELFDAVQARKKARARIPLHHQRRPKHLLSGLLRCGGCGAPLVSKGRDHNGRTRIRCAAELEKGTCQNSASFYLDTVEQAVLSVLTDELHEPKLIARYTRVYAEERQKLVADKTANRARIERRLASVTAEADKVTDFLIKGVGDVSRLDAKAKELMTEEAALRAQLDQMEQPDKIVTLHPATLVRYEQQLESLSATLAGGMKVGDTDGALALRSIVEKVTVYRAPNSQYAMNIEITGRLNALLGDAAFLPAKGIGGIVGSSGVLPAIPPIDNVRFSLRAVA